MNSKIESMIHRIVEQFHPQKIILFGSYARGTATKDSDVDLLVVLPIDGSKKDLTIKIRTSVNGMGISKDIFVATPEDLEIYKELMGTVIYSALKEGKVLYERAA
ncbi:MAG: hypothetical protein A3I11_06950 [Elusimicrobia bacterium RIFCSPLOWO2_02_FULL_39_32]|nr:MAG: hypothetical protein A2034_05050 [Elusimicrobia bacterium GWA2_38_7]OGR81506.1 MAG: hypothetical protein A3B80_05675 [Elusimicrobia bacterium RIFCSPHIGHO2_02_FULL_39_36]OGR91925.1 MAG: hypothetical protein A3I11_06950 [Elusimicrobia bacterium RIFCSPLOWO2_02_FULL_39_32]OGR98781.1 MAG: hypothetical protein A3G85_05480 [Elusimicrobia bacterium RIFCSPLOWO2_12_FULL_39_28]